MGQILIEISWEYFLGIIGTLILIAWYSNSRFSAIETSIDWIKKELKEIKEYKA